MRMENEQWSERTLFRFLNDFGRIMLWVNAVILRKNVY